MTASRYGSIALISGALTLLLTASAYADTDSTNYNIPLDVINAGGVDVSKSSNYLLSDSLGEPIVGYGASSNYKLDSGYRQPSAADTLSMTCAASIDIGSVAGTGQRTGSGSCTVYSDAYTGYNLGWAVLTGSGGTNTGHLISQLNDTIPPLVPAVANTPGAWSVGAAEAYWGGRLRSSSTDTDAEWGTDGVSDTWLNVATTNRTVVIRDTATPLAGSVEIFQFRSEIGASKIQPTGVYETTVTFTVVGY